jgi:hypothetical protein
LGKPKRRPRVLGLEDDAARVCLCCQVRRFGFASGSPSESSNPTLSANSSAISETYEAGTLFIPQNPVVSRGFGGGPWRTRTGDCGYQPWKAAQSVFVSVAALIGSDSVS